MNGERDGRGGDRAAGRVSERQIAAVLGVDQSTIHDDLKSDGNPSVQPKSSSKTNAESDGNPSPKTASQKRKQEAHPESPE